MEKLSRTSMYGYAVAVLLVGFTPGCGTNESILYSKTSGVSGSSAATSSSAGTGAGGDSTGTGTNTSTGDGGGGGGSAECPGECVPLGPVEWLGPALLWIGTPGEAPECPASAPVKGSPTFDDLDATNHCGTCQCDAPHGTCALPSMFTAAAATCAGGGPGVAHTSFDAPAGWGGACDATNPIPANLKCNGVNCVQSLTIAPLTLTEGPCGVSTAEPPADLPPTWGAAAQTCRGTAFGPCATPSEVCAPAAVPGFSQCLVQNGDQECPGAYAVKHLFYKGLTDTRSCTSCACSAPMGGTCTGIVTVFKDGSCSSLAVAGVIDATGSACFDVLPSGQALGSKLAEEPTYVHGACQVSGGEPVGEAAPADPLTYCCLQ
jgi:hypothetical protein